MLIKRKEQSLLMAALGLYLMNKYCLYKFLTNNFMRCYFNDVMGGIVFGITIRIANRFWFKREITVWLYGLLFVVAGIYWEFIAPLYIEYSVGDVNDIAAYSGGGLGLLLLLKILGGKR